MPTKKHQQDRLSPPIQGVQGFWLKRKSFQGRQSFGIFECSCGSSWMSAYAQKKYKQSCKKCNRWIFPDYLWKNLERDSRDQRSDKIKGPHMEGLCEACEHGDCKAFRSY